MSTPRRGRRVPPKGRGARSTQPGEFETVDSAAAGPESGAAAEAARARATRAQNRAAKRAASGVRPKAVRGGQVRGRKGRQTNTGVIVLALAAVAVGAAVVALGNPFGEPAASPSPSPGGSAVSPYGDGTCPTREPGPLAAGETVYVSIETDLGTIVIEVDGDLAPYATGNFVTLAECEYYDGVVFHRTASLPDGTPFVIQGGDPLGTGTGGPGYTIRDEQVTTPYERGTVAMARTSAPNSQGSQFFIVLSDESGPVLESANTYAILGTVIRGMNVADAIFDASNGQENPVDGVEMTRVTVSDQPPPEPTAAPTTAPTTAPTEAPASPTAAP